MLGPLGGAIGGLFARGLPVAVTPAIFHRPFLRWEGSAAQQQILRDIARLELPDSLKAPPNRRRRYPKRLIVRDERDEVTVVLDRADTLRLLHLLDWFNGARPDPPPRDAAAARFTLSEEDFGAVYNGG